MRQLMLLVAGFALMFAAGEIAMAGVIPEFETISAQVMTPAENPETGEVRFFPTPAGVPAGWVVIDAPMPPPEPPMPPDGSDDFCAQVLTYGQNPDTGEWETFPTPCDVPDGWASAPHRPTGDFPPMPVEPDGGIGDGASGPCIQVVAYGLNPDTDEWEMFATPCDVPDGWETSLARPSDDRAPIPTEPGGGIGDGAGPPCIQMITWGENPDTGAWRMFPTPCDVPEGWNSAGAPPDGAAVEEPLISPNPGGETIALEPYVDPETGEIMYPEGAENTAVADPFALVDFPEAEALLGTGNLRITAGKDGPTPDPMMTYGDALAVKVGVEAGLAGVYDLYVALEEPDGDLTFLHHEGAADRLNRPNRYYAPVFMFFKTTTMRFSAEPVAAAPAWEARFLRPTPIFSSAIFPGTPAGVYTAWAILTGPGESPLDPANWREADRAGFVIE